jgi:competence protein ComGC
LICEKLYFWDVYVFSLIKDFAMLELSLEVIILISMLIILAILSLIPDKKWIKFYKTDWLDEFLHPKH